LLSQYVKDLSLNHTLLYVLAFVMSMDSNHLLTPYRTSVSCHYFLLFFSTTLL
jgi:hypothetical protein